MRESEPISAMQLLNASLDLLAAKDATIARLEAENKRMREALTDVVLAHDSYLASLPTIEGWQVSDPMYDACETAREVIGAVPDPAGGMPVEVK